MKILLPALLLVLALIWCVCDEGNPVTTPVSTVAPDPPGDLFGMPAQLDDDIDILLMWVAPDTGTSPSGYNVYRSLDSSDFEKINESVITATSFGPAGQNYPIALYFADTSYDTSSVLVHKYYVVSVSSGNESDPSDMVSCIPNTISRDNNIENIIPADSAVGVDLAPTMSWDAKDSAASYFVFLREADEYYPLWMHRVSGVECTFKATYGTTYLEDIGDSLESIHEYEWLVWAISNDNCGFALSEGTFTTTYKTIISTVVNRSHEAGAHVACWDQTDDDSLQVPEGVYAIHMVANDFDDLSSNFEIADDAEHVGSSCDPPVTIPAVPDLYRTGDIIPISYSVPVATDVRIDIVQ